MKNIFLVGAGRSATALIRFLKKEIDRYNWNLVVGDARRSVAADKIGDHKRAKAVQIDVQDREQIVPCIRESDIVISLLPPTLHIEVAHLCLEFETHLITASYISEELRALNEEIEAKDLIFMTELGLDPGIDHMSAVRTIDDLRAGDLDITAFRSFAGGLIAPDSDDNPWHYKFTWNPRNVVVAGQGTAQFYENGRRKYIPYHRLFSSHSPVDVRGRGTFEMYPNRDALRYRSLYGIEDIPTILRGTLRNEGFCDAWHALVAIGLTTDQFKVRGSHNMTYRQLMKAFIPENGLKSLENRTADLLDIDTDGQIMHQLKWAGLFKENTIEVKDGSPAEILQDLFIDKWQLEENDRDMIIMQHEFEYKRQHEEIRRISSMVMEGHSERDTAMSRLVGYPLGIFTSLVLRGKIHPTGLHIPVLKEVYDPVLDELEELGVIFREREEKIEH